MTTSKIHFAMFTAGLAVLPSVSDAGNSRIPQQTKVIASSPQDFTRITNPDQAKGIPGRLRRTDEEQPGQEMAHLAMFGDGVKGLLFSMSTDLVDPAAPTVSHRANDRIQLALVPFSLVKNADGTIAAQPDYTGVTATGITNTNQTGGARFVTNNRGNEYRNANHPSAYAIADGRAVCVEYNYQPAGSNDTKRYMQCFDTAGATVMPQTKIYEKNNDDCSMNQDKNSTWVIDSKTDGGNVVTRAVAWRGCNGNGSDDGWAQGFALTAKVDGAGKVTSVAFKQTSDVSLCPREERSHGFCSTAAADPNTAVCSWTEGNTQPQRDGVWLAAIDLTKTGQQSILWKKKVDDRKTIPGIGGNNRTYAMRAMHDRVLSIDPATQKLVASDQIIWRSGDLRGNNRNNRKGGTYYGNNIAVIKADKAGMKYVVPKTDLSSKLVGLDGTHLGMTSALFGTTDAPKVGLAFLSGSHTGGGYASQIRVVTWDQAANTFSDSGSISGAPYDRHLYPNYLGNNPGNQGRNYSDMNFIKNPFATGAAGEDAWLLIAATTGKPPEEVPSATCLDCAKRKLAAYITVVPVVENPAGGGTGGGNGAGNGTGNGTGGGDGNGTDNGGTANTPDDGTAMGGCSTGAGAGGALSLLFGFAAMRRRRR